MADAARRTSRGKPIAFLLLNLGLWVSSFALAGGLSVTMLAALRSGSHASAVVGILLAYILVAPLILPPGAFAFSLIGVSYPFGILGIIAYAILVRPVAILATGYRNDGRRILRQLTIDRRRRKDGPSLPWWIVAGAVGLVVAVQALLFVR
jgi:hypothetical protein